MLHSPASPPMALAMWGSGPPGMRQSSAPLRCGGSRAGRRPSRSVNRVHRGGRDPTGTSRPAHSVSGMFSGQAVYCRACGEDAAASTAPLGGHVRRGRQPEQHETDGRRERRRWPDGDSSMAHPPWSRCPCRAFRRRRLSLDGRRAGRDRGTRRYGRSGPAGSRRELTAAGRSRGRNRRGRRRASSSVSSSSFASQPAIRGADLEPEFTQTSSGGPKGGMSIHDTGPRTARAARALASAATRGRIVQPGERRSAQSVEQLVDSRAAGRVGEQGHREVALGHEEEARVLAVPVPPCWNTRTPSAVRRSNQLTPTPSISKTSVPPGPEVGAHRPQRCGRQQRVAVGARPSPRWKRA